MIYIYILIDFKLILAVRNSYPLFEFFELLQKGLWKTNSYMRVAATIACCPSLPETVIVAEPQHAAPC